MAWGKPAARGIDDLVDRVKRDDPKLASLTILKMRKFGAEEAESLFSALKSNTTLTELYASGHAIGLGSVRLLADALACNTTLASLCVGDASFGDEETAALAEGLLASKSLQKLDLEHKAVQQQGAAALARVLQGSPHLQHLILTRNPLKDAGAAALGVGTWVGLQHLDLRGCELTHEGVGALAGASMPHLTTLNLASNPLGPPGGAAAVKLLAAAPQLQRLQLASTGLADAGIADLVAALSTSTSLVELDIGSCSVAAAGCDALAAAVAQGACPLQRLVVADCADAPAASLLKLAEAVTVGRRITSLDLSRGQVDLAVLSALAAAPSLKQLTLLGCGSVGQATPEDLVAPFITPVGPHPAFRCLTELNLAGCGLSLASVKVLLHSLEAAPQSMLPATEVLAIGANEATEHEELEQLLERCHEARPQLHLHWRSGDGFSDDRGQE